MNFTRRQTLKTLFIGGSAFAASPALFAQIDSYRPSLILLNGVTPTTSPEVLFAAIDPIISQNVPVGISVDFFANDGRELAADSSLATLLRTITTDYAGLVEIIAYAPGLTENSMYFRQRGASETAAVCRKIFGEHDGCLTLATNPPDGIIPEISDVRTAGFRNLIFIPETASRAGSWENPTGILQFYGGLPTSDAGAIATALDGSNIDDDTVIFHMELAADNVTDAFAQGAIIGDALAIHNKSNAISSATPSELHLRKNTAFSRHIVLGIPQPTEDTASFQAELDAANIPYTTMDFATDSDNYDGFQGLDGNGSFQMPISYAFDGTLQIRTKNDAAAELLSAIGLQHDAMIAVTADAIMDPPTRAAIIDLLKSVPALGYGEILSLDDFRAKVSPISVEHGLVNAAKDGRIIGATQRLPITDIDRQNLLSDAKIAWSFFERFTLPETGLIPGTVWSSGEESSSYPFATMWDVGTHILALVCATELELIDQAEMQSRARLLLDNLPTELANGLRLPPATISVDHSQSGLKGYDATDAGRLLISLKVLEKYSKTDLHITDIVESWDIAKTIIDGEIHGVANDEFTAPLKSTYAQYVARGLALWGIEMNSPYTEVPNDSETDAAVRVLEAFGRSDILSAEPHTLEAIELGYSDPARTLADVLFTQQVAEFGASGNLVAVSEGPLDRAPWFSYQGYRIGADDPWKVKTIDTSARYQTAGFKRAISMVSSKAAYLWSAARPENYSDQLVAHIRSKAKFDNMGFASGVYTATDLPTANYSDVNTNGIILEAIAFKLRGYKPFL